MEDYTPFDPKKEVLCYVKKERSEGKDDYGEDVFTPFSPLRLPGVITDPHNPLGIGVTYEEIVSGQKRLRNGYFKPHQLERRRVPTHLEQNRARGYTSSHLEKVNI